MGSTPRARSTATTPFLVLLAAYFGLLHRHARQAELLLGTLRLLGYNVEHGPVVRFASIGFAFAVITLGGA